MGHEGHHHEEKQPLGFFASPLHEASAHHENPHSSHASANDSDVENQHQKAAHSQEVPFGNMDCSLHDSPAFHRHAEATTSELFYDLFFVANLTTFTSMLEINDKNSLTAYIGFFALLWLTWYQVSLYDVRFSTDSVFERIAKAIHFGVMVGFAVIGPQWKPGQAIPDYKIYKAFGLILMVSRITLFCQYGVTLFYTRKYKKTIVPLALIMSSTLVAAIIYGALTPGFPKTKTVFDPERGSDVDVNQDSSVYIAWYIVGILETLLTVSVSCFWRVISFKGTHMVQRMSLLTLIILGEGIIVICKSISKIVKNDWLWTAAVVGQIIAAVCIIYFLYMLYFDRLQEEHFGSIKQQAWSFLHFPLHTVLVLVLQGISLLIIWRQAVQAIDGLGSAWGPAVDGLISGAYHSGDEFVSDMNTSAWGQVYDYIPKGVDASKEIKRVDEACYAMIEGLEYVYVPGTGISGDNETAFNQFYDGYNELLSATFKTLFDTFSVTVPKQKSKKEGTAPPDFEAVVNQYYDVFKLVVFYVFIAGGLSLIITTILGFISLPKHQHRMAEYIRLGINGVMGVGLCLVVLIKTNQNSRDNYMQSAWMIPTICLIMFICVIVNHIRKPKSKTH